MSDNKKIITIDQFEKNSVDIIKINLQDWRDTVYVDMRIWHLPHPLEIGSEVPTHKGITMNVEHLPALIDALKKAQEKLSEFP